MISRIFIDRPVFAWVIAIVIMLTGVAGILSLPILQYPDIAPPSVNIRATYTGASAAISESSVTQPIEQTLTGLEGMIYFQSIENAAGQISINVTFQKGTDPDIAQVQVQNAVQAALPRLPLPVQQQGLVVTKSNPDFLMVASLYDASDRSTASDISDYLVSNMQEPLGRLPGVGFVQVFGSQYAMRIWLDPYKLNSFALTANDVILAIQAQNTQVAAGQIGAEPMPGSQMLNATVTAQSRYTTPEEFKQILLVTKPDGSRVLLQDVARVELGNESYTTIGRLNGHPASGVAISLNPGADALKTAQAVRAMFQQQSKTFPAGYHYAYPNDSTTFITISVQEVVKTLFVAIILVVIVIFVFLQSWRATLIPAIAVPVVLLGTFGVLAAAGFSINVLTLFGLVLSIGLLVDDAIVVVENVERIMDEEPGITPRDAAIKSMDQVQMALIAIATVLSVVFLPMAFFGGSVGVIYRQFSITMVAAMALSVVVALVLSPTLAATLLKPRSERSDGKGPLHVIARFGQRFTDWFERTADRYLGVVKTILGRMVIAMAIYAGIVAALVLVFLRLPSSFLPTEDQGFAQLQYTLPPGTTQSSTVATVKQIEHYFLTREKANVADIYMVIGQSQTGTGENTGRGFLALKPWAQRAGVQNTAQAIVQRANNALSAELINVQFVALNPPPVQGIGQASGFQMEMRNTGAMSRAQFQSSVDQLLAKARSDSSLTSVRLNSLPPNPTLHVAIDEQKVGALGLTPLAVNNTLTAAWGGNYVSDFIDRGRVKRVFVQGDAPYRSRPEDLGLWYERSSIGTTSPTGITSFPMAPFASFAQTSWTLAPSTLMRFNGISAYEVVGDAAQGASTGQAMTAMTQIAATLPGTSVQWAGLSYQELLSGGQAPLLYGVSILVVFLCLAALYESWSVPFSVLLVIPLGLLGATLAVVLRGLTNDIYFQVGLLTTMGLSAKNAILIVEFAESAEKQGKDPYEAALEAARLRLRPIIMTSMAFIFGVLPLAIATGAGAQSRIEIGTAVIGGMLTATLLAIFFVPMFFLLVSRVFRRRRHGAEPPPKPEGEQPEGEEAPA
jgi:multidrug efflux pump